LKFAAAIEPDNQDIVQVLERVEKNKISIPSTIAQERLINPFMRVNLKVFYCVVCSDIFSI
jgi:hydroxyacylglutathione hydrolase